MFDEKKRRVTYYLIQDKAGKLLPHLIINFAHALYLFQVLSTVHQS